MAHDETWERGDEQWSTIPDVIEAAAERWGAASAVVDGETTLSYAQLAAAVGEAATAFAASGLEPGQSVGLWAPNRWEWIVAAAAVHRAGGVLVPLNTRFKGGEAGYVLAKSRATHLVVVADFLGTDYVAALRAAMGGRGKSHPIVDLPGLRHVVTLDGVTDGDVTSWADFVASAAGAQLEDRSRPDGISDLLFTSGTTGRPKGVMVTHAQSLRSFRDWAGIVGLAEGDRYLVVNPFFHSFGYKAGWLAALMVGAVVFPHAVFEATSVMDAIESHRITMIPGPPTLYQSILSHPQLGARDLSSLRLAVTGAASIPVELILRMRAELGFETVLTAYGLTETCGVVSVCRQDDDPETIATTSGRAIPDLEVRCVDDAGDEVAAGTQGEVVVRGYNVMEGYFEDPEETAAAIDADGWLHTGDLGIMDERGYLRITDRLKDLFIVGGFNAYPAEIERQLLTDERLAQVAVIGVPDERLGEVGKAFVVVRPGAEVTVDELLAWCREHLANYKVPRTIEIVDALPLNASGKVLKYELRSGPGPT